MIVKIAARGSDPGGLVRYMFGKGHHNEHTNQRTVAGTAHHHTGPYDRLSIKQISADLRAYSQANPHVQIGAENKHVWQCSLSLSAQEGELPDATWQGIAQDYMKGMGFEDPNKYPVRWTAINHGLSSEGNPHIHIVMSLIREDGSRVNIHNDAQRSSKVVQQLEQKYNLNKVQGRGSGAQPITYKGGEKGKAQDNSHEIERVELERKIRSLATASATEAEFVRRARKAGLEIRPRVDGNHVTGYSAGIPGSGVHFAGGKIARDLTLPRLRQRWAENPAGVAAGVQEWMHGTPSNPLVKYGRETKNRAVPPAAVTAELAAVTAAIKTAGPQELREIASDLSGALATASVHDSKLAPLSREVGRTAQTPQYSPRRKQVFLNTGLLMIQLMDPNGEAAQAIMLRQVLSTLAALATSHRARCAEVFSPKEHTMTAAMHTPDEVGQEIDGLATVGVTVGAAAIQLAIQKARQRNTAGQKENDAPVKSNDSPKRKTLGEEPPEPDGPAVETHQALEPDPDRITPLQKEELRGLMEAAGLDVPEAALDTLTPEFAEDAKNQLIEQLGLDKAEPVLADAAVRAELVKIDEMALVQSQDFAVIGAPEASVQPVGQRAPEQWKTGNDPMTPKQRYTIEKLASSYGINAYADIDGFVDFTKAQASGAISELQKDHVVTAVRLTPDLTGQQPGVQTVQGLPQADATLAPKNNRGQGRKV